MDPNWRPNVNWHTGRKYRIRFDWDRASRKYPMGEARPRCPPCRVCSYAFSPCKHPNGITQDEALKEAAEGIKPFKLEIIRLDRWTRYKYVEESQALRISDLEALLTCMLLGSSRASHRVWKRINLFPSETMPPILPWFRPRHKHRHL